MVIRKVYTNGQVSTFLILDERSFEQNFNPIMEMLKEQAERIENLEEQNRELMMQDKMLEFLMEITTQTGKLTSRELKAIESLESILKRRQ